MKEDLTTALIGARIGARIGRFGGPEGAVVGAIAGGVIGYGKKKEKKMKLDEGTLFGSDKKSIEDILTKHGYSKTTGSTYKHKSGKSAVIKRAFSKGPYGVKHSAVDHGMYGTHEGLEALLNRLHR